MTCIIIILLISSSYVIVIHPVIATPQAHNEFSVLLFHDQFHHDCHEHDHDHRDYHYHDHNRNNHHHLHQVIWPTQARNKSSILLFHGLYDHDLHAHDQDLHENHDHHHHHPVTAATQAQSNESSILPTHQFWQLGLSPPQLVLMSRTFVLLYIHICNFVLVIMYN